MKDKKIENSTKSYKNLKANLKKQSSTDILFWKEYFQNLKNDQKCDTDYFDMAINVCDEILKERTEK